MFASMLGEPHKRPEPNQPGAAGLGDNVILGMLRYYKERRRIPETTTFINVNDPVDLNLTLYSDVEDDEHWEDPLGPESDVEADAEVAGEPGEGQQQQDEEAGQQENDFF